MGFFQLDMPYSVFRTFGALGYCNVLTCLSGSSFDHCHRRMSPFGVNKLCVFPIQLELMFHLIGINRGYFGARLNLGPEIWSMEDLRIFG